MPDESTRNFIAGAKMHRSLIAQERTFDGRKLETSMYVSGAPLVNPLSFAPLTLSSLPHPSLLDFSKAPRGSGSQSGANVSSSLRIYPNADNAARAHADMCQKHQRFPSFLSTFGDSRRAMIEGHVCTVPAEHLRHRHRCQINLSVSAGW